MATNTMVVTIVTNNDDAGDGGTVSSAGEDHAHPTQHVGFCMIQLYNVNHGLINHSSLTRGVFPN